MCDIISIIETYIKNYLENVKSISYEFYLFLHVSSSHNFSQIFI